MIQSSLTAGRFEASFDVVENTKYQTVSIVGCALESRRGQHFLMLEDDKEHYKEAGMAEPYYGKRLREARERSGKTIEETADWSEG